MIHDLASHLAEGRAEAEAIMTATVVVRRPTGNTVTNPDFTVTEEFNTVYGPGLAPHHGKSKIQTFEGHEMSIEAAGSSHVVQRSSAHFPVGSFSPITGDVITVVDEQLDPLLIGRHFRATQHYPVKSHMTAYRVFVDELVGIPMPPLD